MFSFLMKRPLRKITQSLQYLCEKQLLFGASTDTQRLRLPLGSPRWEACCGVGVCVSRTQSTERQTRHCSYEASQGAHETFA